MDDKVQKVCKEMLIRHKNDAYNRIKTRYYWRGVLQYEEVDYIDLYTPIVAKYFPKLFSLVGARVAPARNKNDDLFIAVLYNDGYLDLFQEDIHELTFDEMLNEMLSVADIPSIVKIKVIEDSIMSVYDEYWQISHKGMYNELVLKSCNNEKDFV